MACSPAGRPVVQLWQKMFNETHDGNADGAPKARGGRRISAMEVARGTDVILPSFDADATKAEDIDEDELKGVAKAAKRARKKRIAKMRADKDDETRDPEAVNDDMDEEDEASEVWFACVAIIQTRVSPRSQSRALWEY